jgi:predicted membrane channel-forming protein YqfA (hemolysin III family)
MSIARSGVLWRRIFVVLLMGVSASYVWYSRREFPHGGSDMGLAYGVAGSALILLLAFFGIRKRWYRSRFGTLEQWLQSHIYLGVLVLVILLFHTGGRFNDRIAVTALILVVVVVASGIVGAILYVTVPRLLTEVESDLTVDEIGDQLNQLAKSMARIASGRSAAFQRIHDELVRQTDPGGLAGWRLLISRLARRKKEDAADWMRLLGLVPKEEQEELRQTLVISRQRRELLLRLTFQQRYKNVLEFWLYIHVPFTIALLVFAALHIAAVFYYGKVPR